MVGRPFQRQTTDLKLNIKQGQTILTGDQRNRNDITNGQQVSRHSLPTLCFLFFFHRTFLKTILASRTSGTFGFAPTRNASPSAKPKEPLFSQHTETSYE